MNNYAMSLPKLIAHRGAAAFAPENTLSALQKAADLGASWVECDVMLDSRGQAIIFHDLKLHRTTNGRGFVARTPYSVIRQLDAGSSFSARFAGEVVPTLEEWLQKAAALNLGLNLELKANTSAAQLERLIDSVMVDLARYWQSNCPAPLISSGAVECLSLLKKRAPYCLLGYIIKSWKRNWHKVLKQLNCISLHVHHKCLTPERVKQVTDDNYLLLAYTVNDRDRAYELFDMGVDAVFSDRPDLLLS